MRKDKGNVQQVTANEMQMACWEGHHQFDPRAGPGQLEAPNPSLVHGIRVPLAFPALDAAQGHSPEIEMCC